MACTHAVINGTRSGVKLKRRKPTIANVAVILKNDVAKTDGARNGAARNSGGTKRTVMP